jgi:D-alanine--D-alanine ligase
MKKIRVGIIMGGISLEKEVSFNSGRTICDHLDTSLYDIIPLFFSQNRQLYVLPSKFLHRGKISDFENKLEQNAKKVLWNHLSSLIDILYSALHGSFGEDGYIQGICQLLKIPCTGSSILPSSIASHKKIHDCFLNLKGIKTPRGFLITHYDSEDIIKKKLQSFIFPLVVKPNEEGSSLGVTIVDTYEQLLEASKKIFFINNYKIQAAYVQELIEGLEFSCICIEKSKTWTAFEPTEIVHKKNHYIFNYNDKYLPGQGLKFTPARIDKKKREEIKKICCEVATSINASIIVRVDGFITNTGEIIILETNIFPGTAPTSFSFVQAAYNNMTYSDLINHIIYESLPENLRLVIDEMKKQYSEKNNKKMNIGVILGGTSNEKEVSLESGRNIINKLNSDKYTIIPLFLNKDHNLFNLKLWQLAKDTTYEIELSIEEDQKVLWDDLPALVDFIFLGLHGGVGENGSIQAMLEVLNIPYNGSSVLTTALCMNKFATLELLNFYGLETTKYVLIKKINYTRETVLEKIKSFVFPCVVKPYDDGCSTMLFVVFNEEQLIEKIALIFDSDKDGCLVEQFVEGMELTVGVLGNTEITVLPPTYTPKKNTFLSLEEKFLPGEGENITPAPLELCEIQYIQEEIKKAYEILGCSGYVRFDCFYKKEDKKVIILECNSLPAMTPATVLFHQAAEIGINPSQLCDKIIEFGMAKKN